MPLHASLRVAVQTVDKTKHGAFQDFTRADALEIHNEPPLRSSVRIIVLLPAHEMCLFAQSSSAQKGRTRGTASPHGPKPPCPISFVALEIAVVGSFETDSFATRQLVSLSSCLLLASP
jgi:hypothetical protein